MCVICLGIPCPCNMGLGLQLGFPTRHDPLKLASLAIIFELVTGVQQGPMTIMSGCVQHIHKCVAAPWLAFSPEVGKVLA